MERLKVALVGAHNPKFPDAGTPAYGRSASELQALAHDLQFDLLAGLPSVTTSAEAAAIAEQIREEKVDLLLLQLVTFPMGAVLEPLLASGARLGLWATAEPNDSGAIRVNSLCGVNMFAAILGSPARPVPHKWFYGPVAGDLFRRRLEVTLKALSALKRLRGRRIAAVGDVVPGFHDLHSNYRSLEATYGVRVDPVLDIEEIIARAQAITPALARTVSQKLGSEARDCAVPPDELDRTGRLLAALRDVVREGRYDAVAVRCWPEIIDKLGTLACASVAHLNQDGTIAACEGDVLGALSMLLLHFTSERTTTLLDLVDFREPEEAVQLWHCGPTAPSLAGDAGHRLLQGTIDGIGAVVDLSLAPGPATVFRIIGNGERAFLLQGDLSAGPSEGFIGSRGWMTNLEWHDGPISVRDLLNTVLVRSLPHHYALAHGSHRDALLEALAWTGVNLVERSPYQHYLQAG